ncbi:MAG: class I SAM-dependent methyltransferase [Dehalococcoidia bacterium]|nr:class I SAM-dependent methyltransferase [Dehalococcoidia bacterium]
MDNRWDDPLIAQQIDAYWRNSPDEITHRQCLAALVHEQMEFDSDTLLEVGCGTGQVFEAIRAELDGRTPEYYGVDANKAMLNIALSRHSGFTGHQWFARGEAEHLRFKDAEFDHVFAFEVFGHMADCTKALPELIRVARKTAIFTLWIKEDLTAPLEGEDHYEYPADWLAHAIAQGVAGANFSLEKRQMPWTMAYIVRKVQP